MKVCKKLITARNMLRKLELKKSGHNDFAKYQYFELGDFLPHVQAIFEHVGLCDVITFTETMATMTVYDIEDGSSVVFTSPMGSAQLKGCHEVQNIGAVETYQRRYLYVSALAIVEHDALDMVTGRDPVKPTILPVVKVAEKIVGERGSWQIVAPALPEGDVDEWLNVVKKTAYVLLELTNSEDDVMAIFKKNKILFDTVKSTDSVFFKEMMLKFTEKRSNFKKDVNHGV
jgi:hypothetical protein